MRQLGLVLAALVLLVQILKGLSVETSLYPLLGTLFTYADGPVRRALLSSILSLSGVTGLKAVGGALANLHIILMTVLAGALLGRMTQLRFPADRLRLYLLWLVLASAVLPVLAVLTGYVDVLLVLGLMVLSGLLAEGYLLAASLILLTLGLQHEMAFVFGFCLFAGEALLNPAQRKPVLLALAAVMIPAIGYLVLTAHYQPELVHLTETRCALMRPAQHPLVSVVWDKYCTRQMTASVASDFTPWRLIILPVYLLVYGLLPLALAVIAFIEMRRTGCYRQGLALLALMVLPLGLVSIAWDTDRIIILSSVAGWLLLDRWLALAPPKAISLSAAVPVGLLVILQLALAYPAVDAYGQRRVIPPALEKAYLFDMRQAALPVLQHYNLAMPVFLDPATCIDSRCAR